MNRRARSLIRLYPAQWRQRYGAEFEAMLEEVPPGWSAFFDLLKGAIRMQLSIPSFPKLALTLSLAGLLTGLGASFMATPRYTSTAELVNEEHRAGSATAVDQFLASKAVLLSRPWLSLMIQEPQLQLYRQDLAKAPLEDVIEKMRRDLQIAVVSQSDRAVFFRIAFTYGEPLKAQATVQEVISRFYDENTRQQHQDRQASPPMGNEERLERQMAQLESRIAVLEERTGVARAQAPASVVTAPATVPEDAIGMAVVDAPSLPTRPVYPDRYMFMATGFGAGFALAIVIAIFRRRFQPAAPLPVSFA
jgi:hypothetical protein